MKVTIEIPDDQIKLVNGKPLLDWGLFDPSQNVLPDTWEEFCKVNLIGCEECYINRVSKIIKADDIKIYGDYREPNHYNLLPSREAAEAHLALIKLHQLRDCYRQDWLPKDAYEKQEPTYNIHTSLGVLYVDTMYAYGSFLSFQTMKLADKFFNNFKDLITEAGDLI